MHWVLLHALRNTWGPTALRPIQRTNAVDTLWKKTLHQKQSQCMDFRPWTSLLSRNCKLSSGKGHFHGETLQRAPQQDQKAPRQLAVSAMGYYEAWGFLTRRGKWLTSWLPQNHCYDQGWSSSCHITVGREEKESKYSLLLSLRNKKSKWQLESLVVEIKVNRFHFYWAIFTLSSKANGK